MFGYVTIDKMELKVKEYYKYKAYYCGLCMSLKHKYNEISRLSLNYDMTYLIILLSSLYEPNNNYSNKKCIAHPNTKQTMLNNEITDYAAALNIILAYYNLKDNWIDEKDIKSGIGLVFFKTAYKKAKKEYPQKEEFIKEKLLELQQLEKNNETNLDTVSNVFGHLMSELFIYKKDEWEKHLRKIGFFLGKYIYLLDAYDDLEEDKKNNSYNPLKDLKVEKLDEYMYHILTLNLTFLTNEIEKLPLVEDKAILDNILYSGILKKLRHKCLKDKGGNNEKSI